MGKKSIVNHTEEEKNFLVKMSEMNGVLSITNIFSES